MFVDWIWHTSSNDIQECLATWMVSELSSANFASCWKNMQTENSKFVMLGHVLLTTTFPKLSDRSCIAPIRTLVRRESPIFTVEGKGCKRLIRDFEGRSLVPFVKGVDLPQFSAWAIYPLASLSVMGGLFWLDVSLYLENLIMLSPIYRQQFVGWLVTVSGFLACV